MAFVTVHRGCTSSKLPVATCAASFIATIDCCACRYCGEHHHNQSRCQTREWTRSEGWAALPKDPEAPGCANLRACFLHRIVHTAVEYWHLDWLAASTNRTLQLPVMARYLAGPDLRMAGCSPTFLVHLALQVPWYSCLCQCRTHFCIFMG